MAFGNGTKEYFSVAIDDLPRHKNYHEFPVEQHKERLDACVKEVGNFCFRADSKPWHGKG